jgi:hypothetical protein
MGGLRNAYKGLVFKRKRKRPLGRPRHKSKVNIKMHKRNQNWRVWTGLIWFRIRTSGGLL